ncbi:MAG: BrnA antitoxin family protein [Salaquimonas sp.]
MAHPPRRPSSAIDKAEALFKAATTKPKENPTIPERRIVPIGKEVVSLKIDNDVLAHFQDEGLGWQDRINAALRKQAGLD